MDVWMPGRINVLYEKNKYTKKIEDFRAPKMRKIK